MFWLLKICWSQAEKKKVASSHLSTRMKNNKNDGSPSVQQLMWRGWRISVQFLADVSLQHPCPLRVCTPLCAEQDSTPALPTHCSCTCTSKSLLGGANSISNCLNPHVLLTQEHYSNWDQTWAPQQIVPGSHWCVSHPFNCPWQGTNRESSLIYYSHFNNLLIPQMRIFLLDAFSHSSYMFLCYICKLYQLLKRFNFTLERQGTCKS